MSGEITHITDALSLDGEGERFLIAYQGEHAHLFLHLTRGELHALVRDGAKRLGCFLAPQHAETAPVAPEVTGAGL